MYVWERRKYQYLYNDDMGFNFMNTETFDQVSIDEKFIDRSDLLKEGMDVDILFHAAKEIPLTLDMPQYVIMEITYTEPGVKGDTATNSTKPATVESGAEIRVPLFVNQGDKIKIDTSNGSYVERVKIIVCIYLLEIAHQPEVRHILSILGCRLTNL